MDQEESDSLRHDSDDSERLLGEKYEPQHPRRRHAVCKVLLAAISLFIVSLAVAFAVWRLNLRHISSNLDGSAPANDLNPKFELIQDCGNDTTTARHNGCIFDVMLGHWVSPKCFDQDIFSKYFEQHPWGWYWDMSLTDAAPREDVLSGDLAGVWISLEYHYYHCAYLWELQMKSYTAGVPLNEYLWSYGHTTHCADMLAAREWPGRNVTYLETGYTRCILPRLPWM